MQEENIPTLRGKIKVLKTENKIFRSIHDHHLTENDLRKAALELGETEQLKITSLLKLRKKLKDHENPFNRFDDAYLLRYLRYTKFNPDKAFKSLVKFYHLKKDKPDLFELPDNIHNILDSGFTRVLPYRDREDSIVLFTDFGKWNVKEMTTVNIAQLITVIFELITMNPSAQVHADVAIWDVRGFSMQHVQQLISLKTLMLMQSLILECYPMRVKKVYLYGCGDFFLKAYNGVRYLIKKKIDDRITILGSDPTGLCQFLDKDILPKECGGTLEESDSKCTKFLMENLEYLKYQRSLTQTGIITTRAQNL